MNVLAFFAHPDDETMLMGGTLALLARQGANVYYLSATRGEGGEAGDPALCTREELGSVREHELACAVQALGGAALAFLDYVDPTVGPDNTLYPYAESAELVADHVVSEIHAHAIDVLLTHGSNGEYGHPAHRLTNQAANLAIQKLGEDAPLFYTVQAAFEGHPKPRLTNKDDPAHLILDITPVLDAKIQAAMCHRTQHALFVRHSVRDFGRQMDVPEVIVKMESLRRVWPAVQDPDVGLNDPFARLLRQSGCVRENLPRKG